MPKTICWVSFQKKFRISEIAATQLCGFNGHVFEFSIGYDAADVDDIKDIEKYLIKKNHIV